MNMMHILPMELNFKIINSLRRTKKNLLSLDQNKKNCKYVYFLDTPEYGNLGDQAIAYAMMKFMNDFFPEYVQVEVQENQIYYNIKKLKKLIKPDDIICLTGGGNMGVLYQRYEAIRRMIIKNFPNNKIIIFPQTIDYGKTRYGSREFKNAKKIYNNHKNLTLMAREEKSYKIMKDNFDKCNVFLCPDIVLYLNYFDLCKKKNNSVGICLRDDKERVVSGVDLEKINKLNCKVNKTSTTASDVGEINVKNRKKVIENKLLEIAKNKFFITDRLHGMIFAFITNTNCIALPNSNGKVEGVYKWIKNKGNVKFEKTFDGVFISEKKTNEPLEKEFTLLATNIRNS